MADPDAIPTVIISNFAEAHIDFLGRSTSPADRDELINGEDYHGDRTILWDGHQKLVIVNYPIAHADLNLRRFGYEGTRYVYPDAPSHYLCLDILREGHLLQAMLDYAGENRRLRIIPYATTREFLSLLDHLRDNCGLDVETPESPDRSHFWVRDYIDTKSGYRTLASYWMADAEQFLPFGIVSTGLEQAAAAAFWFCSRGRPCVVKADTGESGIGTTIIKPGPGVTVESILKLLQSDPFYSDELVVVEEFIPSTQRISPSLEIRVPPEGDGDPLITYISIQLFLEFGDFCGIKIDRSVYEEPWCEKLQNRGLELARNLQNMGYVGHFDIDCIVSDEGEAYMLEINSRRTGGTHVHEFAKHVFGDDYINRVSLISFEAASSGAITDAQELIKVLDEYLYPTPGTDPLGLVITITSALHKHRFGYILVARTAELALELKSRVEKTIQVYSNNPVET